MCHSSIFDTPRNCCCIKKSFRYVLSKSMFFSLQISELEAKLKDIENFVGKDKQKLVCKSILIINNFNHVKVITLTDTLFYNGLVSSKNENQSVCVY